MRPTTNQGTPAFDDAFRSKLRELFLWRRDVRRFQTTPLAPGVLDRFIEQACLAPSVGLSQPWRFVLVDDPARRRAVIANFKRCNRDALEAYGPEQASQYARLKLAGLEDAPCHLAVFTDDDTAQGHGLGRRTMPEMLGYSAVAAICNLWLAARAENVGMGWVSILDPADVSQALDAPREWKLVGYLCLGYPVEDDHVPQLERQGWEHRRDTGSFVIRR